MENRTRCHTRISSLCQALRTAKKQSTSLGFLAHVPRQRSIHLTAPTFLTDCAEYVPLKSFLSPRRGKERRIRELGKLSWKQRLLIAVTLASSVLQLHQSPWLTESWDNGDIHVLSSGVDQFRRPVINHACVSRSFETQANSRIVGTTDSAANKFLGHLIINKSLFALGIVLIELCLNKTFAELCVDECLISNVSAEPNIADVYFRAIRLSEIVFDEAGSDYGYVVQRCLRCEFRIQDSRKQLDVNAFRDLVFEGVVAPLETELGRYDLDTS